MIGMGCGAVAERARARSTSYQGAKAASAQAPPKAQGYFLEVSLRIGLDSVDSFFDLAGKVREQVEAVTDLRLVAAGESLTRTDLFHMWSLPSADSLREGMIKLAENADYGQLDRLIAIEQQDFLTPIGMTPPRPACAAGDLYVKMTGHLDTKNLAEFQAVYEAYPPLLKPKGLTFWGAFLNVSGRLNRVVSLWIADQSKVTTSVFKMLPGLSLLNDATVEQWAATSYQQR